MSDNFSARYRLLKCIAVDADIRTHSAQEIATGRVVMVHLADSAGPEEVELLRAQLAQLGGVEKNRVLETATLPSGFAIVTEFVAGMGPFKAWLAAHAGGAPTPEIIPASFSGTFSVVKVDPPVAEPPAPKPAAPGSFTQLFGAPSLPASSAAAGAPAGVPVSTPPPAVAAGAFTQMFGTPSSQPAISTTGKPLVSPPAVPPSSLPPVLPRPTPQAQAPGEFTRMFSAAAAGPPLPASSQPSPIAQVHPPSHPAAASHASPHGSVPSPMLPFKQTPPQSSAPPLAPSVLPANAPSSMGGATGALFGRSLPEALPAPNFGSAPSAIPPAATRRLESPFAMPPASSLPSVLPPPMFKAAESTPLSALGGAAGSAAKAGPSDFTLLIRETPTPPVAAVPAAPVANNPAAAPKRNIPMGLIIIINAVIIVALILVFLVLRRPPPKAPALPKVAVPALKGA